MRKIGMLAVLAAVVLGACSGDPETQPEYGTPAEVLVAMKNQYDGAWYERMSFVQTTVQFQADGASDTTTWFEAMELPGKLRIDIGDPASGNSWIFRNDSIYVFSEGELAVGRPTFHPLLLLGFDAYFLESADLVNKLDSLGFDLSAMSDTTWQDRDAYVIGADAGDTDSQQFWIDKERLVFVRLLQRVGPEGQSQQDVRFDNYVPLGGGWVAPIVEFYVDGRLQMTETYHNVKEEAGFDDGFFSPTRWNGAEHWFER